mmetsp:Transcript_5961/g.16681  ORF Transcript_5961/g.16681 Transcript_5961/m.16681 type:complete len:235 (-) Transcript_5961:110-814(-)
MDPREAGAPRGNDRAAPGAGAACCAARRVRVLYGAERSNPREYRGVPGSQGRAAASCSGDLGEGRGPRQARRESPRQPELLRGARRHAWLPRRAAHPGRRGPAAGLGIAGVPEQLPLRRPEPHLEHPRAAAGRLRRRGARRRARALARTRADNKRPRPELPRRVPHEPAAPLGGAAQARRGAEGRAPHLLHGQPRAEPPDRLQAPPLALRELRARGRHPRARGHRGERHRGTHT